MQKSLFQLFTILFCLSSFAASAGGVQAEEPPPRLFLPIVQNGKAIEITVERRMEILEDIREMAVAIQNDALQFDDEAVEVYLHTIPEISRVERTANSLWGNFSDGRQFVLPLLPPLELSPPPVSGQLSESLPISTPDQSASAILHASTAPTDTVFEIPANNRAAMLIATPACFGLNVSTYGRLLRERSYDDVVQRAEIDALKNLGELGVFHIDTHGGSSRSAHGNDRYSLGTATPVSAVNDTVFQVDIVNDRLIYMFAGFDSPQSGGGMGCGLEWNYAITEAFVQEYMTFGDNAFVYLDSCAGASSSAAILRGAFYDKGASSIAAWTDSVLVDDARQAATWTYRFLTGSAESTVDPQLRPFDIDNIYQMLVGTGLDTSAYCKQKNTPFDSCPSADRVNAKLQFKRLTSATDFFGLATPTIKTMRTFPGDGRIGEPEIVLEINGLFGSIKGQVFVNEVELDVWSWEPKQILADIPGNGLESAGMVTVQVHGHPSNPVPLTEWRGTFNWEEDLIGELWPGAKAEYTCDLHFRVDFHDYRETITEYAITPPVVQIVATQNSQCAWTMSGEWTDGDGNLHRLEGEGVMRWHPLWDPPPSDLMDYDHLHFDGAILPPTRQIQMQISGIDYGTVKEFSESGELQSETFQPVGQTHILTLELDEDWNIIGETERSFGYWGGVQHLVWWPDIEALFEPINVPAN